MKKDLIINNEIIDKLSSDNFEERQKIIELLASIHSKDIYLKVEDLLNSEEAITRNSAIQLMTAWGKEVLPILIERTKHPSGNQRLYTANIIGDIKDPDGVDSMLNLLTDEESNIRFAAAEAIGKIGSKQATMPLLHYLHSRSDDPWEQFPLILTLGQLADERAVIPLLQLAENEMLQQPILQAVSNIADEHAIPYILDILKTLDINLQNMAILAIKNLKDKANKYKLGQENLNIVIQNQFHEMSENDILSILNNLKVCITDNDYSIKIGAIFLLGLTDNSRAINILIDNYNFDVTTEIEDSLLYLGKNHSDILIEHLKNSGLNCADIIIKTLGILKISKAAPYIAEYLKSPLPDIRIEAIAALGRIKINDYISELIIYLDDSSPDVRNSVVNVLQDYERDIILPYLKIDELKTSSEKEAFIVKILSNLKPKVKIIDLLKFKNSEDFQTRKIIALALKNYDDIEAFDTLVSFLNDSQPQVREEAIRSLEQRKDGVYNLFVSMINDSSPWVRYCIAKALAKQSVNEEIIDALKLLINDPSPFVQIAAIESAGELKIGVLSKKLFELVNHNDSDISQSAIIALSSYELNSSEQSEFENLLEQQIENKDWVIRKAVARALGKFYNNHSYSLLIKMLDNEDEKLVNIEILNSLGKFPAEKETIPLLINMTLDENLRDCAIDTLIDIGKDVIPYLQNFLDKDDNEIKSNVISILAKISDDRSIQLLVKLASNSASPNIRKQSIIALGNFKYDQRAIWAIMWAANHDNDSLVKQSAKLLLVS